MTIFDTQVDGIPCQAEVTFYAAEIPMRITGTGFGDADPRQPEEFEFNILDKRGLRANWLDRKVDGDDVERILREFKEFTSSERHGQTLSKYQEAI